MRMELSIMVLHMILQMALAWILASLIVHLIHVTIHRVMDLNWKSIEWIKLVNIGLVHTFTGHQRSIRPIRRGIILKLSFGLI